MEKPDVVVGTPSRVQAHIKAQNLALNALDVLIIDEADLLFSFGFEAELKDLIWWVFLKALTRIMALNICSYSLLSAQWTSGENERDEVCKHAFIVFPPQSVA